MRKDSIYALITALEGCVWYNPDNAHIIICDDSKFALQLTAVVYGNIPAADLTVSEVYNFLLRDRDKLPQIYDDEVVEHVLYATGYMELSSYREEYRGNY